MHSLLVLLPPFLHLSPSHCHHLDQEYGLGLYGRICSYAVIRQTRLLLLALLKVGVELTLLHIRPPIARV